MWLVGPWPGSGAEHFAREQQFNRLAWGSAAYMASSYLCRLYGYLADSEMRRRIADKCVRAMQWCYDSCQFEDGALGLFGRDDKWVGMTATAILLYVELSRAGFVPTPQDAHGLLYFGNDKGAELWSRLTVHYTPKHGSWLNQAEIEISLLARQCLARRRIPTLAIL